jgi:integrase
VQGSLAGKWVKKSLNTRDWSVAAATVHEWEAAREIGGKRRELPSITDALRNTSRTPKRAIWRRPPFVNAGSCSKASCRRSAKSKGHERLADLNVDTLRTFRKTWKFAATSAVKRLEYLRGFLRFCEESEWIERNPAKAIKPPKVTRKPTLPFEDAELDRALEAADRLKSWGTFGPKLRALILLLRHSGLRIQDAACLERARLNDDELFLYTQKTGTPVYCPLPPKVVDALNAQVNERSEFFFWDGKSERETTVKSWNRVFQKLFASCDPPIVGGHPHRFRDTFAISLLLRGCRTAQCVDSARAQLDPRDGAALLTVDQGATGAARSRCPPDVGPALEHRYVAAKPTAI